MMLRTCPGSMRIKTPELEIVRCTRCGGDVEIFSDEVTTRCPACGAHVSCERQSCADWCPQARECLGSAYDAFIEGKNSRREL